MVTDSAALTPYFTFMSSTLVIIVVTLVAGFHLVASVATRWEEREWNRRDRDYNDGLETLSAQRQQQAQAGAAPASTDVESTDVDLGKLGTEIRNRTENHPGRWKGWKRVKVQSVTAESPDCRSFVFQPSDDEAFPPFLGGQYLMIRLTDPATRKPVSRCYSLSSGPDEKHYRITVKRVPGGLMSNLLHDTVEAGDEVEIQVPRGKFHYVTGPDEPLNLIAAGIGITPMLSMMFQSLAESAAREVHLFYQVRNASTAAFLRPLRQLISSVQGHTGLRMHVWFSKPDPHDVFKGDCVGRLDSEAMVEQLGHRRGEFLICGPDVFMNAIAQGLVDQGVDEKRVKFESFGGKSKGPGAITVDGDEKSALSGGNDAATHSVSFRESDKRGNLTGEMDGILDLAEELGVDVDSGCRSGECGACIKRLLSGSVQYDSVPECDFETDEAVLCIAKPATDIVIDA